MQTRFHVAPGLGDLMNGWFAVPQNPMRPDGTVIAPSVMAVNPNEVVKFRSLGDLVSGSFVVPQNPVAKETGLSGLGCGGCGCSNYNYGLSGFSDDPVGWLSEPSMVGSVPNWMLWGGVGVAALFLFAPGGSEYRAKSRALRSQYRGYKRVARAAA
jgi:hypothetical protein